MTSLLREHAALAPMYLGVKVVLAKSFARIHRDNLINFGILPMTFVNPEDYHKLEQDDVLEINNIIECLREGIEIEAKNPARNLPLRPGRK